MCGLRSMWLGCLLVIVAWLVPGRLVAAPRPIVERPFIVVLDPGHGGSNSGCQAAATGVREKQVTLAVAKQAASLLQRSMPHVEVHLTRDHDATLGLSDRVEFANGLGADVFVSIHANASPSRSQQGFETYVLTPEPSHWRGVTAASERGASVQVHDAGVQHMLDELKAASQLQRSMSLAHAIQLEQKQAFPERQDRGVRQAFHDVLLGLNMPGALFEVGFLDHREEGRLLQSAAYQRRIAEALVFAIVRHYRATVLAP